MNDYLISREEVLNLLDTAFENGAFDGRYAYENLVDAVQNLIHPLETKALEKEPCDDAVSRQAAINAFERFIHELGINDEPYNYGEMALSAQNVPSVEPERKPGHWEWDQRAGEYVCSECGCNPIYERTTPDVSEIDKYRFCRWCGAKMEVEE